MTFKQKNTLLLKKCALIGAISMLIYPILLITMYFFENSDGKFAEMLFHMYMALTLIPLIPIFEYTTFEKVFATCGEGFAAAYCAPTFLGIAYIGIVWFCATFTASFLIGKTVNIVRRN